MQTPFKLSEINLDNLQYKNIKESNNKKIIFIKYKDQEKKKNCVFQIHSLKNELIINNNELELPIICTDSNKNSKLINFFNMLDKKVMEDAKKNPHWFNHLEDKTNINYNYIIHNSSNYNNGTFKLKYVNSSEFKTLLYLNNDTPLDLEDIPASGTIKIILEFYAIWIHNNNFGILLRPIVLSFVPNYHEEYNYTFLEETEYKSASNSDNNNDSNNDSDNDNDSDNNSDNNDEENNLYITNSEKVQQNIFLQFDKNNIIEESSTSSELNNNILTKILELQ